MSTFVSIETVESDMNTKMYIQFRFSLDVGNLVSILHPEWVFNPTAFVLGNNLNANNVKKKKQRKVCSID